MKHLQIVLAASLLSFTSFATVQNAAQAQSLAQREFQGDGAGALGVQARDFSRDNDRDLRRRGQFEDRGRVERDGRDRSVRGREFNSRFGYERTRNFGRRFNFRGRSYFAVRAPRFQYPRGWSYRRWTVGTLLPLLFLAEPYYVDYEWLGLPPPPLGSRWVRYGSDALLVNQYTGRVEDAVYGVFYL